MPVPSNPQDLINIIREKLFNNTSGLIEEPDLREVLENIVKVLDAKFSMFSPNLTEEQYAQWNLILDFMLRETKGVLTTSSSAPTGNAAIGKYLLSGAGIYTKIGGLVATADKLNYAYFDGTTWSKVEVDFEEPELDVDGGALSYETAMKLLSGFKNDDPTKPKIINIPDSGVLYGGNFLKKDNTIEYKDNYPYIGVLRNVPVNGAKKLKVSNFYQTNSGNRFASIVGMKNGIPIVLLPSMSAEGTQSQEYDITGFETVSFQIHQSNPFPTLQLEKYEYYGDVKEYIDDNLKVLDYFLNPFEVISQDLPMPQAGEVDGAIITTSWHQYAADGTSNGVIAVADLPVDFDTLEIEGNFNIGGSGVLWLGGFNNNTNIYEQLLKGVAGNGKKTFTIDRRYDYYAYSIVDNNQKFRLLKTVQIQKEKDSVKEYIDNHISSGSTISNEKSAQIKRPSKVLRLEFTTSDPIPVDKTTIATGTVLITDLEGLGIKKVATIEVQGSSSATYPKKNWTFALYNDEAKTDSFKLRVGNWAEHSEFVFKSNWIDATHARNLISNHIWEDIVQSRAGYPKRENEIAYVQSYTEQKGRFDSGALTHVDGVPCELYIKGRFYGIGNFNLGKKRENYDLKSGTQNHIQLEAKTHANFYSYVDAEWEIRNPKTPDANFLTKINAWFAANALSGQAFKDAFPTNHDVKNAVDFFLLAEFIQRICTQRI